MAGGLLLIIIILLFTKGILIKEKPNFIIEIDNTRNYNVDVQVNYININTTSGYHTNNRLQTLLYRGKIYKMEAEDSQIKETYIKNGDKYFYEGAWNLDYDPDNGSITSMNIKHNKTNNNNIYKLVIRPDEDKVIYSYYTNDKKTYTYEYEYLKHIEKDYTGEAIDGELFNKFSLPQSSKYEPYLSGKYLEFFKNSSMNDFKKHSSTYILERYVKNLSLSKEEVEELRRLELIRSE